MKHNRRTTELSRLPSLTFVNITVNKVSKLFKIDIHGSFEKKRKLHFSFYKH